MSVVEEYIKMRYGSVKNYCAAEGGTEGSVNVIMNRVKNENVKLSTLKKFFSKAKLEITVKWEEEDEL